MDELIADAVAKGGKVVAGGKRQGSIVEATLIDHVTPAMRIYSEESFGPVKSIVRVKGVDEAIRGVRQGQVVQVHEWSGLWQTGERYRVGERVLLFLYPQSKLGLTSPVGGTVGRLQIDRNRRVALKSASAAGARTIE